MKKLVPSLFLLAVSTMALLFTVLQLRTFVMEYRVAVERAEELVIEVEHNTEFQFLCVPNPNESARAEWAFLGYLSVFQEHSWGIPDAESDDPLLCFESPHRINAPPRPPGLDA